MVGGGGSYPRLHAGFVLVRPFFFGFVVGFEADDSSAAVRRYAVRLELYRHLPTSVDQARQAAVALVRGYRNQTTVC